MKVKKVYDQDSLAKWKTEVDVMFEKIKVKLLEVGFSEEEATNVARNRAVSSVAPPKVNYVELEHTGTSAGQRFSTHLVAQGVSDGWMVVLGDKLIIKAKPEDLLYDIKRAPGYYCCFDGKSLPDAIMAAAYVKQHYVGQQSPDPSNPLGYEKINFYDCVLNMSQHEKYKAGSIISGTFTDPEVRESLKEKIVNFFQRFGS